MVAVVAQVVGVVVVERTVSIYSDDFASCSGCLVALAGHLDPLVDLVARPAGLSVLVGANVAVLVAGAAVVVGHDVVVVVGVAEAVDDVGDLADHVARLVGLFDRAGVFLLYELWHLLMQILARIIETFCGVQE